jgi:hypothetical protein
MADEGVDKEGEMSLGEPFSDIWGKKEYLFRVIKTICFTHLFT